MLPPSTSEYDHNDASDHDLESTVRAQAHDPDAHGDSEALGADELSEVDAELEAGDDLGEEEEPKPKKKGVGKGVILAGVGVGIVLVLSGAAYVMQGQMKQAPVAKKIAVDPSLLEAKPSLPAEPKIDAPAAAAPNLGTPAPNEMVPTLNGAAAPGVTTPSAAAAISSPPSDPFAGSTSTTAMPTPATPAASAVVPPVAPVVPATTPPASAPATGVAITPVPGADPFGSLVQEKPAPKAEKSAPEKVEMPVATTPTKPAKVTKPRPIEIEEVEISKPRPAAAKPRVKKPSVVRQDMTVSEPHPSQERVQPQSSESFHGYEKLF